MPVSGLISLTPTSNSEYSHGQRPKGRVSAIDVGEWHARTISSPYDVVTSSSGVS